LRALEALPPVQREAFLLHEEAGLSVAEIAAATGSNERGSQEPAALRHDEAESGCR